MDILIIFQFIKSQVITKVKLKVLKLFRLIRIKHS